MRFCLVCFAFGAIHLHLGGAPMHMDTSFGRPRDPVMDQVANILKGILSNLTKHRSLVAIADEVSKSTLTAEQRAMVLDDLERQVKKLNAGGESYALDAYLAEHPTEKDAPKKFKESLVTVVSALKTHVQQV